MIKNVVSAEILGCVHHFAKNLTLFKHFEENVCKGLLKKKFAHTSEVKGARASKKLVAHRGRSSPKKTKGSGMAPKPSTQKLPRHEVFPSTVSKKILSLSGSVVSQKPPSKKI